MKRLNICIDIDGTVTEPYYWMETVNKFFDTNVKPDDVYCYEIHKIIGITDYEYLSFYDMFGEKMHREAEIRLAASQVINKLYTNHFVHIVTAREEKMRDVSLEWFKKYKIPMDSISLLNSHNKVGKAKELNCDIFIEDRYENVIQLSEAGYEVLLLDTNYNRGPLNNKVHRVSNWYQIENFILEYAEEKAV